MADRGPAEAQDGQRAIVSFNEPHLYVDGFLVDTRAVARSELMTDVQACCAPGLAPLELHTHSFHSWAYYAMAQSSPSEPGELVQLLGAASVLIDRQGEHEIACRLAAAIRGPLRASVRLLKLMTDVRLPACQQPRIRPRSRHSRALLPAPLPALTDTLTALETLSRDGAITVLSHLHPLELVHLPVPLLCTALGPCATPPGALDLRDPLLRHITTPTESSAIPQWQFHCNHLLEIIAKQLHKQREQHKQRELRKRRELQKQREDGDKEDRDKEDRDKEDRDKEETDASAPCISIPALRISYVNAITAGSLSVLGPDLRSLELYSPPRPPHICFLPTANALTTLKIVSASAPTSSLIRALVALRCLKTLDLALGALEESDMHLLNCHFSAEAAPVAVKPGSTLMTPCTCSGACSCSSSGRSGSSGSRGSDVLLRRLACALAGLTAVHLHTSSRHDTRQPWPPMLAQLLPVATLRHFFCYPFTLPCGGSPQRAIMRAIRASHSKLPMRSLCLCWPSMPQHITAQHGGAQLARVAGTDVRAVFAAAAAAMPLLDTVQLDASGCIANDLSPMLGMRQITRLRLEGLSVPVASAAVRSLNGLCFLADLHFGLQLPAGTAGGAFPERQYNDLLRDLRLSAMQLTRLGYADVPVLPAACTAVGRLPQLHELSWTLSDASVLGVLGAAHMTAFADMLLACTGLRTLHMPFWPRAAHAGPITAALAGLADLRGLAVTFVAPMDAPELPAAAVGEPGADAAAPLELRALESLDVHMTRGAAGHLLTFVEQLDPSVPNLTTLKLRCSKELAPEGRESVAAAAATLERTPQLRQLHLPGGCMQHMPVLSAAIGSLSALRELVFWGRVGVMEEAWRPLVQLPLDRGLVEIALPEAEE
eukprot:jgi/Ulvmu1/2259/UM013_0106.1